MFLHQELLTSCHSQDPKEKPRLDSQSCFRVLNGRGLEKGTLSLLYKQSHIPASFSTPTKLGFFYSPMSKRLCSLLPEKSHSLSVTGRISLLTSRSTQILSCHGVLQFGKHIHASLFEWYINVKTLKST